jgi:6-phosphofructokinase 2
VEAASLPQLVTLTMGPAIDVSTAVERVVPAHKLRCDRVRRDPGGGGVNVARVAARLGLRVTAIYPAGGHGGRLLRRLIEAEGIESAAVAAAGETRHNFAVFERESGEQFRFLLPAEPLRPRDWRSCLASLAKVGPNADFVCASGSLPPGVPDDFYARVARLVAGWGGNFALDTSGPALQAGIEAPVRLIKPSLNEMRALMGEALDGEAARVNACRALIARGNVAAVALTLGPDGALLVTRDAAWRAAPLPIRPLSTVGAGDSFFGAMLSALAEGMTLEDAFRRGVAGGTAALLAAGTGLAEPAELNRLLPMVAIERVEG